MTHTSTEAAGAELAAELRALARDIFSTAQAALPTAVERALDPAVWAVLEETGLARITGAEDSGGSAAGWQEAAAVLAEAAAAGIPLPLLEHDLLAGWLREAAGLPAEPAAAGTFSTSIQLTQAGAPVSGPWLSQAASVVVLDTSGEGARVCELATADLAVEPRTGVSGEPRDIVRLPAAPADAVSVAPEIAQEWLYRGALGRAVQIAGAAESVTELCIDHVTSRVQFGRPIGRFQAVQQLVTDVACETAMVRTIVDRAVLTASELGLQDVRTRFLIAAAKACAGGAVEVVVRNAHQIHGAIGTTLEHSLQRLTRPLTGWRREFGSTAHWETTLEGFVLDEGLDLWDMVTR